MGAYTVGAFVARLMPDGSVTKEDGKPSGDWTILPRSPIDAFAVMASLVERSGAYRHVVAPSNDPDKSHDDRFELLELASESWVNRARAWGAGFHSSMKQGSAEQQQFADIAKIQYPDDITVVPDIDPVNLS